MIVKIRPDRRSQPRPANSRMPSCTSPTACSMDLKLVGFAVWERRSGGGRNVTFPARAIHG